MAKVQKHKFLWTLQKKKKSRKLSFLVRVHLSFPLKVSGIFISVFKRVKFLSVWSPCMCKPMCVWQLCMYICIGFLCMCLYVWIFFLGYGALFLRILFSICMFLYKYMTYLSVQFICMPTPLVITSLSMLIVR